MTDHQCSHRLGDGRLCGSPRQASKNFCYYHNRVHENYVLPGNRHYIPPPLTDLHNISIALSHVWSALSKSMITHKQACAMAYQIQLAKQTVKDILKMEKERKEDGLEGAPSLPSVGKGGVLNDDITSNPQEHEGAPSLPSVGKGGVLNDDITSNPQEHEGAPSLPSVGKGGVLNDDTTTEPSGNDDDPAPTEEIPEPIHYDPAHPPLCMEPALRPFNCYRNPAPDSTPTWTPISTEEYKQMREYLHMGPGDPTPDIIDLRREMQSYLNTNDNPTPERIAEVLCLAQQDIQARIKDREDAVRRHHARQRDEQNKKLLGLEY